jgi:hypothetical protein
MSEKSQTNVTGATLRSDSCADDYAFGSLLSSSRESRVNSHESSRKVRFMTDPGYCGNGSGSGSGSSSSNSNSSTVSSDGDTRAANAEEVPDAQCQISLAALPSFAAAEECSPVCLPKWVLKCESGREQQQLEKQTLEMSAFVDRLLGVGILVKQRLRWGRSRVSRLQLGADMHCHCHGLQLHADVAIRRYRWHRLLQCTETTAL